MLKYFFLLILVLQFQMVLDSERNCLRFRGKLQQAEVNLPPMLLKIPYEIK